MFTVKGMFKLAAAAAVALVMVACGGGDKGKQTFSQASEGNMIPDNAVMAMKIDAEQLFDKALGAKDSELRQAWTMAKAALPMYIASMDELGEYAELAGSAVKDPSSLGIRLDEPVVVSFAAEIKDYKAEEGNIEVCLVALLDDSQAFVKVADVIMDLANEEVELGMTKEVVSDSYTYYTCTPEEGVSLDLGVAQKAAVLRIKTSTLEETKSLKTSMLGLFKNGGPAKSEGLEAFYASKGDMAFWMDMEGTMNMALPFMADMDPMAAASVKEYMPMYKNSSMVTDLVFKEGQTVLQLKVFGSKEMMAYAQKYGTAASGKYLNDIPFYPVFAVNVAMKDFAGMVGEMTSMSKEYKEVFDYLKTMGIDEELLAGFPGNITFAVNGTGINKNDIPGMILIMDCGENVWEYAKPYLIMYAEELSEDVYCVEDMFCISYEDGTLMASDIYTFLSKPYVHDYAEEELAKEIAEGGMLIDFNCLPKEVLDDLAEEIDYSMTGEELLEYLNSVVVTMSPDHMTTTVALNMGDKNENLLAKIVLFAVQSVF